jgi:hypothetical protein
MHMKPEVSEYLRLIGTGLDGHDDDQLLAAVGRLIEYKPADAAMLIWARFFPTGNPYFQRLLAYALAKTAASGSRYLWAPLAAFVAGPYSEDDATLVNVLSALQLFDEHDDILSAVLAPHFGAFAAHCLASDALVVDACCDVLLHLYDRGLLKKLLTRTQVRVLRQRLEAAAGGAQRTEQDAQRRSPRRGCWGHRFSYNSLESNP